MESPKARTPRMSLLLLMMTVVGCSAHVQLNLGGTSGSVGGQGGATFTKGGSYSGSGSFAQSSAASFSASKSGSFSYSGSGGLSSNPASAGFAGVGIGAGSDAASAANADAGASSLTGAHITMGPGMGITIGHHGEHHPAGITPSAHTITISGAGASGHSGTSSLHAVDTSSGTYGHQGQLSTVHAVQPSATTYIHQQEKLHTGTAGLGISALPVHDAAVSTAHSKVDSYGNPVNAMHIHIYPGQHKETAANFHHQTEYDHGTNAVGGLSLGSGSVSVGAHPLANAGTFGVTQEKTVNHVQTSGSYGGQNTLQLSGEKKNHYGIQGTSYGVPQLSTTHLVGGSSGASSVAKTGTHHITMTLHHDGDHKYGHYGGTFGGAPGVIAATGPAVNYPTGGVTSIAVSGGPKPVGGATTHFQQSEHKVSYGGSFGGAPGIVSASGPALNYPSTVGVTTTNVKPLKIEHGASFGHTGGASLSHAGASTGTVTVAKPVISITTEHKQGHYSGTYGGAPGIITATGPAINHPGIQGHVTTASGSTTATGGSEYVGGIDVRHGAGSSTGSVSTPGLILTMHPVVSYGGGHLSGGSYGQGVKTSHSFSSSGASAGSLANGGTATYGSGGLYGLGGGNILGGMLHGVAGAISGAAAGALAGASAGTAAHSSSHGFGISGRSSYGGGGGYKMMRQYGTLYKGVPLGKITITTRTHSYPKLVTTGSTNSYRMSSYGLHPVHPVRVSL